MVQLNTLFVTVDGIGLGMSKISQGPNLSKYL